MSYLNSVYDGGPGSGAVILRRLRAQLEPRILEQNQARLLHGIEQPLASVLCDMEKTGFKVDTAGLKSFSDYLGKIGDECTEQIYSMTGEVFNINSPKQLVEVLFDKLGLPPPKKTKTGYSTAADVLEKLRPMSPVIDKIFEYRQVMKLKTTYADGLCSVADKNGRIHTNFNQTVAATGRLSSTEPNLQNIPVRQELAELRRYFIRSGNYCFLSRLTPIESDCCCISETSVINAFKEETFHASRLARFSGPLGSSRMRKRAECRKFPYCVCIVIFHSAAIAAFHIEAANI